MKRTILIGLIACLSPIILWGQTNWADPLKVDFPVIQGRAWNQEIGNNYTRLPERASKTVREAVWNLSRNAAGLSVSFYTDAPTITVKYTVKGSQAMAHMPATGVSGVDLYATDCHGTQHWCAGNFQFGDTITYQFNKLSYHNIHQQGNEYQLFLPLYTTVASLQIGTPEENKLTFIPVSTEKPIVIYGTSIAQGACASRPGMAWTNILQRKIGSPVINLGFSGNGQLEPALFDLLSEIDAQLFIIDCMPNMTNDRSKLVLPRTLEGVKRLREKSGAPILLVEHCGYLNEGTSDTRKESYITPNIELKKAYDQLMKEGVKNLHYLTHEEIALSEDSQVDGVHATDLGMLEYAKAYEAKINVLLNRPMAASTVFSPCKQRREPDNYEWNKRHEEVLALNSLRAPEVVMIGNSITHFWAGEPISRKQSGVKAWKKLFDKKAVTNMGFGWDRIENVLWRVYHGELDGYNARNIFLMIGTNNLDVNTDKEIANGITELVSAIRARQPQARLHVIKILPRRAMEKRVAAVNSLLQQQLSVQPQVTLIDVSQELVDKDGILIESLFLDGLHPNEAGYLRIATQLKKQL